jgi:hypothetical protein
MMMTCSHTGEYGTFCSCCGREALIKRLTMLAGWLDHARRATTPSDLWAWWCADLPGGYRDKLAHETVKDAVEMLAVVPAVGEIVKLWGLLADARRELRPEATGCAAAIDYVLGRATLVECVTAVPESAATPPRREP